MPDQPVVNRTGMCADFSFYFRENIPRKIKVEQIPIETYFDKYSFCLQIVMICHSHTELLWIFVCRDREEAISILIIFCKLTAFEFWK